MYTLCESWNASGAYQVSKDFTASIYWFQGCQQTCYWLDWAVLAAHLDFVGRTENPFFLINICRSNLWSVSETINWLYLLLNRAEKDIATFRAARVRQHITARFYGNRPRQDPDRGHRWGASKNLSIRSMISSSVLWLRLELESTPITSNQQGSTNRTFCFIASPSINKVTRLPT